ncbi:hypothetical protein FB451DRAFT_1182420 [Mycena latifolia]|nr:hypothetical protein FB451DRAFT_1182420 [Mycena latifolia]
MSLKDYFWPEDLQNLPCIAHTARLACPTSWTVLERLRPAWWKARRHFKTLEEEVRILGLQCFFASSERTGVLREMSETRTIVNWGSPVIGPCIVGIIDLDIKEFKLNEGVFSMKCEIEIGSGGGKAIVSQTQKEKKHRGTYRQSERGNPELDLGAEEERGVSCGLPTIVLGPQKGKSAKKNSKRERKKETQRASTEVSLA